MQNDAMKNVVENDAEQDVQNPTAAQGALVPKKRKSKKRKAPVRKGLIISAPREKPDTPISARLTKEENEALKTSAAVLGKRSKSQAIRIAVQQYVARNGSVQVPASLGVVDGIYQATMHDDVVELANQLRALEFALLTIAGQLAPSPEADQLHLMLGDASKTLEKIAGRVRRKT
jgi:hypothetical protein